MNNNMNTKKGYTLFLTSMFLGYAVIGQVEPINVLNNLNILTVSNASEIVSGVGYIKIDDELSEINIKKEPSLNEQTIEGESNIIGKLRHGDKVNLVSGEIIMVEDVEWVNISTNTLNGWIENSNISLTIPETNIGDEISNIIKKEVYVEKDGFLNVRNNAFVTENNIVGQIENGDIVEIKRELGSWYFIECENVKGWVVKTGLKEIKSNSNHEILNEWYHKDNESEVYIKKVREYDSNIYIANVKVKNAVQFDHVYSDEELKGTKKTVHEMIKGKESVLAINSNGFTEEGYACGIIGKNGKIDKFVKNENTLVMDYSGMLHVVKPETTEELENINPFWATTFGPTLIENYKNIQENSTNLAYHPRVAIGQKGNSNEFIIIVVDGRSLSSKGVMLSELAELFEREGARIAYNLDGGGSATLSFKGKIINKPSDIFGPRKVIDALVVGSGE